MTNTWTVTVEEDSNGDLVLPIPVDMLSQLGWCEGTDLFWVDNHNGSYTLTTKNPDADDTEIPPNNDVGC